MCHYKSEHLAARLRTLGGGFRPIASNSLLALPAMSVRTQVVLPRRVTGMARTSFSSRMASTTVSGRCPMIFLAVAGVSRTKPFARNNAAERALRGIALGRKSWLFCGSDRGGHRAAAMYSLIVTAKMNGIDPQAWLADVFARLPSHPAHRIDELLPWNWKSLNPKAKQAA